MTSQKKGEAPAAPRGSVEEPAYDRETWAGVAMVRFGVAPEVVKAALSEGEEYDYNAAKQALQFYLDMPAKRGV